MASKSTAMLIFNQPVSRVRHTCWKQMRNETTRANWKRNLTAVERNRVAADIHTYVYQREKEQERSVACILCAQFDSVVIHQTKWNVYYVWPAQSGALHIIVMDHNNNFINTFPIHTCLDWTKWRLDMLQCDTDFNQFFFLSLLIPAINYRNVFRMWVRYILDKLWPLFYRPPEHCSSFTSNHHSMFAPTARKHKSLFGLNLSQQITPTKT